MDILASGRATVLRRAFEVALREMQKRFRAPFKFVRYLPTPSNIE